MNANLKTHLKILEALGVTVVSVSTTGSSHYKFVVTAHGKKRMFIAGNSPSDQRGLTNFRALVKRWLRSLTPQEEKRA